MGWGKGAGWGEYAHERRRLCRLDESLVSGSMLHVRGWFGTNEVGVAESIVVIASPSCMSTRDRAACRSVSNLSEEWHQSRTSPVLSEWSPGGWCRSTLLQTGSPAPPRRGQRMASSLEVRLRCERLAISTERYVGLLDASPIFQRITR